MIEFEEFYTIAVEDISMIRSFQGEDANFPFGLKVTLKSGQTANVIYQTKEERDIGKRKLLAQISREQRQDYERMYNKLYLLEYAVNRIDKRQLRIWRILSKLLPVKMEDVEHD